MADEPTNEQLWRDLLTEHDSPTLKMRRRLKRYPGNPRCKQCLVPPRHPLVKMITKKSASRKNPCIPADVRRDASRAQIELTMLFAESGLDRCRARAAEFHRPDRFHKEAAA